MHCDEPLISIVMPSFNQGQYIEQAITSITGQNYSNIELVIIDGGSTDNTLEVIKKYEDRVKYWVSEPDDSAVHALNKGFQIATGDILAWLNSDDMYLPCALQAAAAELGGKKEPALVYGGALFADEADYAHRTFDCGTADNTAWGYEAPAFEREKLTYQDFIIQPGAFWTRELWQQTGPLDETVVTAFDWEWFIRASKICDFKPLNKRLAVFRFHESNITRVSGLKRSKELVEIVRKYSTPAWAELYQAVCNEIEAFIDEKGADEVHELKKHSRIEPTSVLKRDFWTKYDRTSIKIAFNNLFV